MAHADAIGMFWEDLPAEKNTFRGPPVQPPIPDTGWRPPTYFPDLSSARVISLDCETYDPELLDNGPGWARGRGHIIGVSIGAPGGYNWYFPIRHEVEPQDNMDPATVMAWLRHTLGNPACAKVGANLTYDIGWLKHEGVEVKGELVDVQFAEALLDERAQVSLEVLAQKYLGEGKESNLLYRWCADYFGGAPDGKQRAHMHQTPPRLCGPYAESDADLPLRLAPILYKRLQDEGLVDLFRLECALIPVMIAMRFAGVSVDIAKAEKLRDELVIREAVAQEKLNAIAGMQVDINSGPSLARAFDAACLPYPRTDKGAASFTKLYLTGLDHPIAEGIREIRKLSKLRGTFIESYVLDAHIDGKVYGQFHQLRNDGGGTRSGRLSGSTPNLQNLPSRDDELAPLVRGLFVPDAGHLQWRKYDYSQIEYRFLAHFAVNGLHDHSADDVRRIFCDDPDTDYHEMTRQLVLDKTGQLLGRKPIKNINFGLIYGMGVDKLAAGLGLSSAVGKQLFADYHKGAPFAKATMDQCSAIAQTTGIITTILGRRSRFDLWEPTQWDANTIPLPYHAAVQKWGKIRRAHTHKALNRRLQGSSADMLKKAMLQCWDDGIFDAVGIPRLTVHDELDFSDPGGCDEAFRAMQHVMEHAIELRIPIKADCDIGPDWGHCSEVK